MREPLADLWLEWSMELRQRRRAEGTLYNYSNALTGFDEWLEQLPGSPQVTEATRQHVTTYIAGRFEAEAPQTVLSRFRRLRAFYRWAVSVTPPALEANPMEGLREPSAPIALPPVLTTEQVEALFATCDLSTFIGCRDLALMKFLVSTGTRIGECMGIQLDELDLKANPRRVTVHGKGDKYRPVGIGLGAAGALTTYLRVRRPHRYSYLPDLWLGARGPLREAAVWKITRDRGIEAGIPGMHPHLFRHTWAHMFRAAGGSEGDLAQLGGWEGMAMVRRYGASAAAERALETHRKLQEINPLL